jgi:hypothetical protein
MFSIINTRKKERKKERDTAGQRRRFGFAFMKEFLLFRACRILYNIQVMFGIKVQRIYNRHSYTIPKALENTNVSLQLYFPLTGLLWLTS